MTDSGGDEFSGEIGRRCRVVRRDPTNEAKNRTDEATVKPYKAAARSDEATARSAEATARSDEATVKSDYFAKALSGVSLPWVKMFNESSNLSTFIDVSSIFALIFKLKKIVSSL